MSTQKHAKPLGKHAIAVGYLRVSTDGQEESPAAQKAAIMAWGGRERVAIARWYTDRGVSGAADASERPALIEAIAAVRDVKASYLVVARRDRLARDVVVARAIARLVERAGARVRSADGVSDAAGPEGALMRGVVDLFAEYERELIRARTKAALARKRARGEVTGTPPYGYTSAPRSKKLVPEPHETYVVGQIVALYKRGATLRSIAAALNAAGFRARAGGPWMHHYVANVLRRRGLMPASSA